MTRRETLTDLFNLIIKDATKKPPFLNFKVEEHKDIQNTISALLTILSSLIKPYFINDNELYDILLEFETIHSAFDDIKSITMFFNCTAFVNKKITKYKDEAISFQEYESADNLNRFCDLRLQYQTI